MCTDELLRLDRLFQEHTTGTFVPTAALQAKQMAPEADRSSTMGNGFSGLLGHALEQCSTVYHFFRARFFGIILKKKWFKKIPVGIVPCRLCFADTWSAVTETNIAILSARITKFSEASIFLRL